jgi:secreted PhoX family phosphatase
MSLDRGSTFAQILSRRALLKGGLAAAVLARARAARGGEAGAAPFGFVPVVHSRADTLTVPAGYRHERLIHWGDAVLPGAPAFDPRAQTPHGQSLQFGYNCDFIGYLPLPPGSRASDRGLLVVNHEYTTSRLMFPDWDGALDRKSRELVDIEMAAHGLSVIAVRREASGRWRVDADSPYNRRVTADTPMRLAGPAAGAPWLRTGADPAGTRVLGTLNNCSGGVTPWGTVLTCEENVDGYFAGPIDAATDPAVKAVHARYGLRDRYGWARHHPRFGVATEPHEPLRFGWVVEIDPYDPGSIPVKRTALGRFKHEAATTVIARDGRAVVYSGDDGRFEYLYKFVSSGRYDPGDRAANMTLLDAGTLHVARFADDGSGVWIPLTAGVEPLVARAGFPSPAHVLIDARTAGDLVGATRMDRPEDVEADPGPGRVYAVMTNNTARRADQVNGANPRADNRYGHIIELVEDGGDHAAVRFRWDIFIACGDPRVPDHRASYQGQRGPGWLATPDNIAFDPVGRLWVATDGQDETIDANDGLYAVETTGPGRGTVRQFLSGPVGCEVCGPAFTPDGTTLFVAIQHPGEVEGSTFARPASRWPDGRADMPPRPTVVAIRRADGGAIGT